MRWLVLSVVACSAPTTQTQPSNETTNRDAIPIVDSHVHLAYCAVADQLAAHGVRAVVDLASPESALGKKYPIAVIQSGPMLTRPGGYPLESWGAAGYGIGCADYACVGETIDRLKQHGAGVIKITLDDKGLDPRLAGVAAAYAHQLHLKVAVHALTDEGVRLAADMHADILAHTPVESLSGDTIAAWRGETQVGQRVVISTLAAFGGSADAVQNLGRLRAAGLTVLYGTDLGNLRVDGVSDEEIALLKRAGLDDAAVQAAMTTVPWRYWGFER
jgi:hypothetical protein